MVPIRPEPEVSDILIVLWVAITDLQVIELSDLHMDKGSVVLPILMAIEKSLDVVKPLPVMICTPFPGFPVFMFEIDDKRGSM